MPKSNQYPYYADPIGPFDLGGYGTVRQFIEAGLPDFPKYSKGSYANAGNGYEPIIRPPSSSTECQDGIVDCMPDPWPKLEGPVDLKGPTYGTGDLVGGGLGMLLSALLGGNDAMASFAQSYMNQKNNMANQRNYNEQQKVNFRNQEAIRNYNRQMGGGSYSGANSMDMLTRFKPGKRGQSGEDFSVAENLDKAGAEISANGVEVSNLTSQNPNPMLDATADWLKLDHEMRRLEEDIRRNPDSKTRKGGAGEMYLGHQARKSKLEGKIRQDLSTDNGDLLKLLHWKLAQIIAQNPNRKAEIQHAFKRLTGLDF